MAPLRMNKMWKEKAGQPALDGIKDKGANITEGETFGCGLKVINLVYHVERMVTETIEHPSLDDNINKGSQRPKTFAGAEKIDKEKKNVEFAEIEGVVREAFWSVISRLAKFPFVKEAFWSFPCRYTVMNPTPWISCGIAICIFNVCTISTCHQLPEECKQINLTACIVFTTFSLLDLQE
ncbi:hypothetical protein SUGI_1010660 [Cryptomeria japonica]|nr:hypothetical protein SUGI_1010660 [Cryptomeria japonica]